jgi:hypothetical protein
LRIGFYPLCVALLTLSGAPAFAQRNLVTAEIEGDSPPVRSGAPMVMNLRLTSQAKGLLEGHLEITLLDGLEVVGAYRSEDLVISSGVQTVRIMFAAIDSSNALVALDFQLKFIGKHEEIDLGVQTQRVPLYSQRSLVIGFCNPWQAAAGQTKHDFLKHLQLEAFRPYEQRPDQYSRDLATYTALMAPGELSSDPLGYCGFDMIVLADEGLGDLREKQLTALEAWVAAGGSLCVAPSGNLSPAHIDFLNRLSQAPPDAAPFSRDATGKLASAFEDPQQQILTRRHGLGRVALLLRTARQELGDTPAGRRAVAFLWKVRQDQVAAFADFGKWDAALCQKHLADWIQADPQRRQGGGQYARVRMAPVPIQSGDQLLQKLMPRSVQVVPLWVIGLILLGYVLVIGPGDYYVLGLLKQRKLTWVVFPVVTIGVTLFTMWLSNYYMQTTDQRRAAVFVDIGDQNRVVRTNRFELLFSGTPQVITTQINRGIFAGLDHQMFGGATWQRYANPNQNPSNRLLVKHAQFAGRIPTQYTVFQDIPQWTPQLNRILSLAPADQSTKLDWEALGQRTAGVTDPFTDTRWHVKLTQQVQQAYGPGASSYLARGREVLFLSGIAPQLFPDQFNQYQATRGPSGQSVFQQAFLADVCGAAPAGLFALVSQISPAGGRGFEDLTLLDSSDPNQWMLIVAVQRDDDLMIYRKLYRGAD